MNTTLFKNKYRIKSTRLNRWDYSQEGAYYTTICTKNRELYFGDVKHGTMELSDIGEIARQYWREIPEHFPNTELDEFIVMPNHVHGIIRIVNNDGIDSHACIDPRVCTCPRVCRDAINRVSTPEPNTSEPNGAAQKRGGITGKNNPMNKNSLSRIIRWYKGRVTYEINRLGNGISFQWQPRFHDHIIRNEESLNKIREYIRNNPLKWESDRHNPEGNAM